MEQTAQTKTPETQITETQAADRKTFWCPLKENQTALAVCRKTQGLGECNHQDCPYWQTSLQPKAGALKKKKSRSKSATSGKLSYQTIIAAHLNETGVATLDELVNAINTHPTRSACTPADHKNVSVGVSILCNKKRQKNPLAIQYSRITKLYYLLDSEAGKLKWDEDKDKKAPKKTEATPTPAPEVATPAEEPKAGKTPKAPKAPKVVKKKKAKK